MKKKMYPVGTRVVEKPCRVSYLDNLEVGVVIYELPRYRVVWLEKTHYKGARRFVVRHIRELLPDTPALRELINSFMAEYKTIDETFEVEDDALNLRFKEVFKKL